MPGFQRLLRRPFREARGWSPRCANLPPRRSTVRASCATGSSRCSQLSRMSSARRSCRNSAKDSGVGICAGETPKTEATAGITAEGPESAPRSTNHPPSGKRERCSVATSIAALVFPTPPGPTSVTRRWLPSSTAVAATSFARPIRRVGGDGRFSAKAPPGLTLARGLRVLAASAKAASWQRSSGVALSAAKSCSTVSRYGARRAPTSSDATALALMRARSASASCERPAAVRRCRRTSPNVTACVG